MTKNDETPEQTKGEMESEEVAQSPFCIRDELPLTERLYHIYRRIMFADKLRLGYLLVKAGEIPDRSGYFDECYVEMVQELQNEAFEALREAEAEIEREGGGPNGGPSSEGLVH